MKVFVGCYTKKVAETLVGKGKGIYSLELNEQTGQLTLQNNTPANCPSYLAISFDGKSLYAVEELSQEESPKLVAYSIQDNQLSLINQQPLPGSFACHLLPEKNHVLVTCYLSGNSLLYPKKEDGSLLPYSQNVFHEGSSINQARQEAPHPHMFCHWKDDLYFIVDLGIDAVLCYQLNNGQLHRMPQWDINTPKGAGPRHMVFSTDSKIAFVFAELTADVFVFQLGENGFELKQTLKTLPETYKGEPSGAAIKLHPNGKFLYLANRGANCITICTWDEVENKLTLVSFQDTFGETPRDFNIDPPGKFLIAANQDSDSLVVFSIDSETGLLHKLDQNNEVATPTCVVFFN